MRIEKIPEKPDRAGCYRVQLSTGNALRLYRQTIEDFDLYPGLELTEEQLSRLQNEAGKLSAKMRAVRIVSAANVSVGDLRKRLEQKGESAADARAAVEWMQDLKLVDDRETARQLVERCIQKGYGKARARQLLYEKKIPKEYWDEALEDYPEQDEKIMTFLQSRLSDPADKKAQKRAVDALFRRGHSWNEIRKALSRLNAEGEWEEE